MTTRRRFLSPGKARESLAAIGAPPEDVDIALAFGALHDRCRQTSALYPFRFSRFGLEPDGGRPRYPYLLLLVLASFSSGSISGDDGKGSVFLERLVATAMANFWGPGSRALRFGSPAEPERPTIFQDAIRWLAKKMDARPLPMAGATFRRADGGVDVVAWRSFEDGAAGPSAVVQVTYEADLRAKSLEAAANDLDRWLEIARPMPVLASPVDSLGDRDLFLELNRRVLFLDRWRILEYLANQPLTGGGAAWAESVVAELAV